MSLTASQVSVGTTETSIIANNGTSYLRVTLKNDGTQIVFLGPTGVLTTTGFQLKNGDPPVSIELAPGQELFGIVAATSETVSVVAS